MVYFVDIDNTICKSLDDRNYNMAKPIQENIDKVNWWYDAGHIIVYWTARGTGTGMDWREVTEKQFKLWGVKYHEIRFDKPVYDVFIDDKAIESKEFFDEES